MRRRKPLESNFELQITALIDTLVIILIFLLKSIATDTLEMDQGKGVRIPDVFNGLSAGKGSRLEISSVAVSWEGKKYLEMKDFNLKSPLNGTNLDGLSAAIASTATQEKTENKFDGKLFLQADKSTPFPVLQEVLKTAKAQGYKDIRFVGAKYN